MRSNRAMVGTPTAVHDAVRTFLRERGRSVGDISPDDVLTDALGLSSLEVIELLVWIGAPSGVTDVRTVADLCRAVRPVDDVDLDESHRRADARRRRRNP